MDPRRQLRFRLLVCGMLVGATGMLLFGAVHAIVIVPIWGRVVRGLGFAIVVALLVAWAYHEYRKVHPSAYGAATGVRFGVLLWLAGLPAMIMGFGMRVTATSGPVHWWVDVATVALAALGGAALLWMLARSGRAALAGGLAVAVLLAYNGGPMPIDDNRRAIGLPLGYLGIEAICGGLLAVLYGRLVAPAMPAERRANRVARDAGHQRADGSG